jgi:hypothetical protein
MPERGLEDYASPILRAAVFHRIFPGAQIGYEVVDIADAFPMGHREYEGKAAEAVRCTIIFADGTFIVAHKEIDLRDRNRERPQTPEELAKDETKALGRALRDAGIPQRLSELKLLMQWYPNATVGYVSNNSSPEGPALVTLSRPGPQESLEAAFPGSTMEEDHADAGSDEPSPEQALARRFAMLEGGEKRVVVEYARELGCNNVMKAGDHVDAIVAFIEGLADTNYATAADPAAKAEPGTTERYEQRRQEAIAALGDEEPF